MQEDLRLRFKMKGRREGTSHWILETPGEVLHTLKQLKRFLKLVHVPDERILSCQEVLDVSAYGHQPFRKNASSLRLFVVVVVIDTTAEAAEVKIPTALTATRATD
ncbi:hypothetical protein HNY73_003182 [Argiope bruennichi]|uniref:Uncharacterized protein n=1 Tax=Argiope bruennichi TaxID=94029 RepID=A0A8T0FYP5_ARGBR|nr:hypothetical protein HNY73_003182 [Argiope bruennichi]